MTVQELCDRILEIYETRMTDVLEDKSDIEDSDFEKALTVEWLADNIQSVFEISQRKEASQAELIGELETNAFLASFQKMYEGGRRTRIDRWAKIYTTQNKAISENGPLKAQLRHIGVKIEDEWLADTIPMREESA